LESFVPFRTVSLFHYESHSVPYGFLFIFIFIFSQIYERYFDFEVVSFAELHEFFVEVLFNRKLAFEIVTIKLVKELNNVTWRNVDVVISHIIELEEVKVLSASLSNKLKHVTISTGASDGFF